MPSLVGSEMCIRDSYCDIDILGIKRKHNFQILNELLYVSTILKIHTLRLINDIASDFSGRSYLIQSDQLIISLVNIFKNEQGETIVRRNALGSLQKLSLRKKSQIIMIQHNIIKLIVKLLKEERFTLQDYSFEYAAALLMNLSLRSIGKNKCLEIKEELVDVIQNNLENENTQVRTFINGTLFAILSKSEIKSYIMNLGLINYLHYLANKSQDSNSNQVQYIIQWLNLPTEQGEHNSVDEEQNDNDDPNYSEDNDISLSQESSFEISEHSLTESQQQVECGKPDNKIQSHKAYENILSKYYICLLYTSPSPRDQA
eukprot:TRINITY_DN16060_c0_g2_i2.p1 TRINITY_DN16060_c0_g2~~TRINITY_DN16060_c0_g2_i2.p1  ORF type:complete len:316 (+),score=52.84 TRINITY_DN16060_c0_g2_i2:84-1031(+)